MRIPREHRARLAGIAAAAAAVSLLAMPPALGQAPLPEVGVVWKLEGFEEFDNLGSRIVVLDDIDGDGVSEFAVSAPRGNSWDPLHGQSAGYVIIASGRDASIRFVLEGERTGEDFGRGIGVLGDFDGDGFRDVGLTNDRGIVAVYSPVTGRRLLEWDARDAFGSTRDQSDIAIAGPGDVDGDGYIDITCGDCSHRLPGETYPRGRLTLCSGRTLEPLWTRIGPWERSGLGCHSVDLPDLDGDGLPEILTRQWMKDGDAAYLVAFDGDSGDVLRTIGRDLRVRNFGWELEKLGDMTGDGIDEIGVSGEFEEESPKHGRGRVWVLDGLSFETVHYFEGRANATDAFNGDRLGIRISAAGDVDGDGAADVLLGTDRAGIASVGRSMFGHAYLRSGRSGELLAVYEWFNHQHTRYPFVTSLAPLGDVNGDGKPEILIGSAFLSWRLPTQRGEIRAMTYDPDGPTFVRGDVTGDGRVNVTDVVAFLRLLFVEPEDFPCTMALDVNWTGRVELGDPIDLLAYLFHRGPAPAPPFPECARHGGPAISRHLSCEASVCTPR